MHGTKAIDLLRQLLQRLMLQQMSFWHAQQMSWRQQMSVQQCQIQSLSAVHDKQPNVLTELIEANSSQMLNIEVHNHGGIADVKFNLLVRRG